MKKTLFLALFAILLGLSSQVSAQDCEALVLPHVGYNADAFSQMPQAKVDWYCLFSRNSFAEIDEVPDGVQLHNLSEVINYRTGDALPNDYAVDLNVLSYYAYNFNEIRAAASHGRVYFSTPGSAHRYLMLRTFDETFSLAQSAWNAISYDPAGNRR